MVVLFIKTEILCIALAGLEHYSVDQADLELRDLPSSATQILGLKECTSIVTQSKYQL